MKKYFFLSSLLVILLFSSFALSIVASAEYDAEPDDLSRLGYGVHSYEDPPRAYYNDCALTGADPNTFEEIQPNDYAKDKNQVYYHQYPLLGLNPNKVQIKSYFSPDKTWLMYAAYDGNITCLRDACSSEINPNNLSLTNDEFIWSGKKVFGYVRSEKSYRICVDQREEIKYELKLIADNADPENFTTGYKITPDAVYWYGKKMEEADVGSFELLHFGFAKDKNNVFFEGNIVYGADPQSFVETPVGDVNYYVDKNGFFGDDDGQHYLTVPYMNKKYPKDAQITQNSLSSAISTYESKYPNYTPQPAQPALGSPEEAGLKKFQEEVAKAQQEEVKERKQNMIRGSIEFAGILLLGGIGYVVAKRRSEGLRTPSEKRQK